MSEKSDIPKKFSAEYYDEDYFADPVGKTFRRPDGSLDQWGYRNPTAESPWFKYVVEAWKTMFNPKNLLDVGCGRGTVVAYARDAEIDGFGFDFSQWAVSDEGRYLRCKREWLLCHDATKRWSYDANSFDLVTALDFYEHISLDDIPFVINEMYRVAKQWIFLQIATVGGGCELGRPYEEGYILTKGDPIPMEREGNAVAGHVTVQPEPFWYEQFEHDDWLPRRDMVNWFTSLMADRMNKNWLLNTMIVLEYIG